MEPWWHEAMKTNLWPGSNMEAGKLIVSMYLTFELRSPELFGGAVSLEVEAVCDVSADAFPDGKVMSAGDTDDVL